MVFEIVKVVVLVGLGVVLDRVYGNAALKEAQHLREEFLKVKDVAEAMKNDLTKR